MKRRVLFVTILMAASMVFYACGGSDSGGFIGPRGTSTYYFAADDGHTGIELWKTNGTDGSTVLVEDINVSLATGSVLSSSPSDITEAGGVTYFTADDGSGRVLFRINSSGEAEKVTESDGTTTVAAPVGLTDVGGTLYYRNTDYSLGMVNASGDAVEVFLADGSTSLSSAAQLTDVGGTLYLSEANKLYMVNAAGNAEEVFAFDGVTSFDNPANLTDVVGLLYMTNSAGLAMVHPDGHAGPVFMADGTTPVDTPANLTYVDRPVNMPNIAGTFYLTLSGGTKLGMMNAGGKIVEVVNTAGDSLAASMLTDVGGTLYFKEATDGLMYVQADGEATLVTDGLSSLNPAQIQEIASVGGKVVFEYFTAENGYEPWIVNSAGSAEILKEINECGDNAGWAMPDFMDEVEGVLYFSANDCLHGGELWRTEGTAASTMMVRDINTRTGDSYVFGITEFGSNIVFTGYDGIHGAEPWISDGVNTSMIADLYPGYPGSAPADYKVSGSTLFFRATIPGGSNVLAMTNGTETGTRPIAYGDGTSGYVLHADATDYDLSDNTMYFVDGTASYYVDTITNTAMEITLSGTTNPVAGTNIGKFGETVLISTGTNLYYLDSSNEAVEIGTGTTVTDIAAVGSTVYFSNSTGLFSFDSTGGVPSGLAEITNSASSSVTGADDLSVANGKVFFYADSFVGTNGLFFVNSGGDAVEILEGGDAIEPAAGTDKSMLAADGTLYITNASGTGLCAIDTNAATLAAVAVDIGTNTSGTLDPASLIYVNTSLHIVDSNGALFFINAGKVAQEIKHVSSASLNVSAMFDVNGWLYVIDGDTLYQGYWDGPVAVSNGTGNVVGSTNHTVVGNKLFMNYDNGTSGAELWVVDTAQAYTAAMIDINNNPLLYSGNSNPISLVNIGGTLYFSAFSPAYGYELWKSDGTAAGTMPVKDINATTLSGIGGVS